MPSPKTTPSPELSIAHTADQVYSYLTKIRDGAGLFFDVDNTLITPQSHFFRNSSPYKGLIDDIKKKKDQFPNYEAIISNWRRSRKSMLVDENWPNVFEALKQNCPLYGLTKMDTGSFGSIDSMEVWRHEELTTMGLHFSLPPPVSHPLIKANETFQHAAICHNGIFMTGSYSKREVVLALLKFMTFPELALVDDRIEELEDVRRACEAVGIPFIGILFKGVEALPGTPHPHVAEFQKHHLLKTAELLEDEEATQMVKP